mmetsp:Transcript_40676/g.77659  ORF Transcript_40676/g.77659 Transcript_40676/m.77659 type:complete len:237 (-) Transcript_40676:3873-4583(-)
MRISVGPHLPTDWSCPFVNGSHCSISPFSMYLALLPPAVFTTTTLCLNESPQAVDIDFAIDFAPLSTGPHCERMAICEARFLSWRSPRLNSGTEYPFTSRTWSRILYIFLRFDSSVWQHQYTSEEKSDGCTKSRYCPTSGRLRSTKVAFISRSWSKVSRRDSTWGWVACLKKNRMFGKACSMRRQYSAVSLREYTDVSEPSDTNGDTSSSISSTRSTSCMVALCSKWRDHFWNARP